MGKAYPFSDQNGAKPLADGAAHTYIDYIREYSPPPPPLGKSACVSSKIMARGHFVISVIKMLTVIWGRGTQNLIHLHFQQINSILFNF